MTEKQAQVGWVDVDYARQAAQERRLRLVCAMLSGPFFANVEPEKTLDGMLEAMERWVLAAKP